MSSVSEDIGVVDACELNDIELSEGDRKLAFRPCCGLDVAMAASAGDRDFPLPKILPPPSDLRAAMTSCYVFYITAWFTTPYCYDSLAHEPTGL